jgi:hypothetical protein
LETKASRRPSGLQRGRESDFGSSVTRRGVPPAAGITQMSVLRVQAVVSTSVAW